MTLPIYTYGLSVLNKETEPVTPDYPELKELIAEMYETMQKSDGVGLAAPQIGRSIRMAVIGLDALKDEVPEYAGLLRCYINPEILEYDETEMDTMEEGCLSIPGISEPVKRPTRIYVKYQDTDFNWHEEWVDGFLARVMQHEFDHLDGILFTDRLSPLRKQLVRKKLAALRKGKFSCRYKTKSPHA